MKIITCPNCPAKFDVSDREPGKKFRCSRCKTVLEVPQDLLSEDEFAPEPEPEPEPEPADEPQAEADSEPEHVMVERANAPTAEGPSVGDDGSLEAESTLDALAADVGPGEESAAAPVADPAAASPKGPVSRPPGGGRRAAPRASARAAAATDGAPKKKSKLMLVVVGVVVLGVLGGGGFFAWKSTQKTGTGDTASSDEVYARKLTQLKNGKTDDLSIALWCRSNKPDKYEFHLDEAVKKNPNDSRLQSALAERYWSKLDAKAPATAEDCLALAKEATSAGLSGEAKRLARQATTLDGANEEAWKTLGAVKFTPAKEGAAPRWVTKAEADRLIEDDKRRQKEAEDLAGMSDRQKKILDRVTRLRVEFGAEMVYRDDAPLLFCMQTSPDYVADLKLDEYVTELKSFYTRFYESYGTKFGLGDLNDQIMVIWIFRSRAAYRNYGDNKGLPAAAGGHWENDAERLMLFVSSSNDDPDGGLYGTIFHETTHMIVFYATKMRGHQAGRMFWFTEGIATFLEPFSRDKDGKVIQPKEMINKGRLQGIKGAAVQGAHVKWRTMLAKTYAEFGGEMQRLAADARKQTAVGLLYYAQVWSMNYFFYNYQDGKYAEKYEAYFKEELDGKPGIETFIRIFGDDIEGLEKEWLEYTKSLK